MLTDILKEEHKVIVETLHAVKEFGIGSKEGQDSLFAVKQKLLAHLQKEDNDFYPFLREEAKHDPQLLETVNTFARDMENISKAAMDFFQKYEGGGGSLEFAKDFSSLTVVLTNRIRQEENVIYREYKKRQKD